MQTMTKKFHRNVRQVGNLTSKATIPNCQKTAKKQFAYRTNLELLIHATPENTSIIH